MNGKETRIQRSDRIAASSIGQVLAPSIAASSVIAYVKLANSSQYRVWLSGRDSSEVVNGRQLRELLREDVALSALGRVA